MDRPVARIADAVTDAVALFGAHVSAAPGAYDLHPSRVRERSRGRDKADVYRTVSAMR